MTTVHIDFVGPRPKVYKNTSDLDTLVGSDANDLVTTVNTLSLEQDECVYLYFTIVPQVTNSSADGATKLSASHSLPLPTSPVIDVANSPSLADIEVDEGVVAIAVDQSAQFHPLCYYFLTWMAVMLQMSQCLA